MTPTQKVYAIPKAGIPRPPLPLDQANPHIRTLDTTKPPPVKFQEIIRDEQATIVGRVKIATPNGHAFILRRLDTGAISATTMFRAAFPTASDEAEKGETTWIKLSFDISGANKSGKARFAGTWVTPDVALYLADNYSLGHVISCLAAAVPDPSTTFRRAKHQLPTPTASPAVEPGPTPAKRRREASPASPITTATVPPPAPVETTVSPPHSRVAASPAPRRSARLRSPPATATLPTQSLVPPTPTPKTPRSRRGAREEITAPAGSDETAVDEDVEAAKIAGPNMHEDILEQKELIAKLKADRAAAAAKVQQEAEESAPPTSQQEAEEELLGTRGAKRPRDEESAGYKFNFKEPGEGDVTERAIATNSRVRVFGALPPERKSLAWGALAFAAGFGAIAFLPNLQSMIL